MYYITVVAVTNTKQKYLVSVANCVGVAVVTVKLTDTVHVGSDREHVLEASLGTYEAPYTLPLSPTNISHLTHCHEAIEKKGENSFI